MSAVGGGPIVTLMNLLATSAQYNYTTIGNTTLDAGQALPSQVNRAWGSRFTAAYNGIITAIHAKVKVGANIHAKFFAAADSAGAPTTVLGVSAPVSLNVDTSSGPVQVDATGLNISVISGDVHLFAVTSGGGYATWSGRYSGTVLERTDSFNYATPPGTVGTLGDSEAGQSMTIWADFKF